MLTLAKFLLTSCFIGALALLGAGLLQTAPQSGLELTPDRVEFAVQTVASEFPAQVRSFSMDADSFVSRNATTARFEFESMSDSMASSLTLNSWLPSDACNWIENGMRNAALSAASKPASLGRNVPIVHRVLNSTSSRLHAISNSAPTF
jgi:hypothetical protein